VGILRDPLVDERGVFVRLGIRVFVIRMGTVVEGAALGVASGEGTVVSFPGTFRGCWRVWLLWCRHLSLVITSASQIASKMSKL